MSDQGTLTPLPFWQVFDADGIPADGAKLYTYESGTTTPATIYSDPDLDPIHALTNPTIADASGEFPPIYLSPIAYKFVLKDSAGNALGPNSGVIDPVTATPSTASGTGILGIFGETVSAGDSVYISKGDGGKTGGYWYKSDADLSYASSEASLVGLVSADTTSGMTGTIIIGGVATANIGITPGTIYYVSATAGGLTTSVLPNSREVGIGNSTSTLLITANNGGAGVESLNLLQIEALLG